MKDVSFIPTPFNRDEDIHVEEEARETITFPLSDEEILSHANEAGDLNLQLKDTKAKFAQVKSDWSGKIKGIESQINYKFQVICDKAEDREVDCVKRRNFTKKIVQFLHKGIVVKERPMTEWESTHPNNVQASLNGGSHHTV